MQEQVRTLYRLNGQGRLLATADTSGPTPADTPAPLIFLGRTVQGNCWHLRHDLPAKLATRLGELCRREPPLSPQRSEPGIAAEIRLLLNPAGEWRGPAYLLHGPPPAPAHAVRITAANAHLLSTHFPAMLAHPWPGRAGPVTAALVGGQAVAVCTSVRFTAAAAEAGVEATEAFRGQGHASAAAALWAHTVQAGGRLALYSTSWDNHASQGVARRLGAVQYGEDWSLIRFCSDSRAAEDSTQLPVLARTAVALERTRPSTPLLPLTCKAPQERTLGRFHLRQTVRFATRTHSARQNAQSPVQFGIS